MRFSDSAIILTGVGREGQVGSAIASAFAAEGAALVLIDRAADEVRRRADALRDTGARVSALTCDLTDAADVARVTGEVCAAVGGHAAALVNIAGGFAMSGPVADSDPSVLTRQLAINLTTAYLATRAFLPLLRSGARARAGASIVYFASIAALPESAGANMSAYAISKSGVLALMRAVAAEEKDSGVRANAVAPSAIRTADNLRSMGAEAAYVERESVADVVLHLCSAASRDVTGQVIRLTGRVSA